MRKLVVLGSTGSVGSNALDVARSLPELFRVDGLAARRSHEAILAQARLHQVPVIALEDEEAAEIARRTAGDIRVLGGEGASLRLLEELDADVVLQATVGAAALETTLLALRSGALVALANKESLVMAGPLLMETARAHGATLIPVDSEHSAIFQCLRAGKAHEVERLILTSSGGALRDHPLDSLGAVTPEDALAHPNWKMGQRITIDSATMMNKALEVAEAVALFDVTPDQVRVVQHAQSIVHSMVEFRDGSVIAQMGRPDMRLPILFALAYPERPAYEAVRFSITDFATLTFAEPDPERYPALELGFRAARAGGTAGAVLNAADEIAVEQFLAGEIPFPEISRRVAAALEDELQRMPRGGGEASLEEILDADARARQEVHAWTR